MMEDADEQELLEAAEEQELLEAAEEQELLEAAEEQELLEAAEEQELLEAAEEQDLIEAAEKQDLLDPVDDQELLTFSTSTSKSLECPVCLDDLQLLPRERHTLVTICGHLFCSSCLPATTESSGRCPSCRKGLSTKDWIRVFL